MKTDILVIDTGVDTNNSKLTSFCKKIFHINDRLGLDDDINDHNGHGTAIIDLYRIICPQYEIIMCKAFESDYISEDKLFHTLEFIYQNVECKVVSLSGGIVYCEDIERLQSICKKILNKGTIIVAAFDNTGSITFPACFPEVVGVDWSEEILNTEDIEYWENSVVNIRGGAVKHNLWWINGSKRFVSGSSFIVPYIVKMILANCHLDQKLTINNVLQTAKKLAINRYSCRQRPLKKNAFKIEKAILIPFNKEIEVLIRNKDLLDFEIMGLYDFKFRFKTGASTKNFMKTAYDQEYYIKSVNEIDWDSNFDTVILGHIDKIISTIGVSHFNSIIQLCCKYRKNIYSLDNVLFDNATVKMIEKSNVMLYYPVVDDSYFPYEWIGKMYLPSRPCIGVFGTSVRQGKFSVQLFLKRKMIENGFKVGMIGTEPTSMLFGSDEIYTIGYNSNNIFGDRESIAAINNTIYEVELNKPDVILFGSQSNTIAPESRCLNSIPYYSQSLLYAIRPDICILCINSFDDYEYVKKTINYIEAIGNSYVIGIVVSPVHDSYRLGQTGKELFINNATKKEISMKFRELNRNIYMFNEEDLTMLYKSCIDYFS